MSLVGNPTQGSRVRPTGRVRPAFYAPIFTNGGAIPLMTRAGDPSGPPAGGLVVAAIPAVGSVGRLLRISGMRPRTMATLGGPLALVGGGGFQQQGPAQPGFIGGDPRSHDPRVRMAMDHIQHAQPIQAPDHIKRNAGQ